MTKTTWSLLAILYIALGLLAFFLASNGRYQMASSTVLGIVGFFLWSWVVGWLGCIFECSDDTWVFPDSRYHKLSRPSR